MTARISTSLLLPGPGCGVRHVSRRRPGARAGVEGRRARSAPGVAAQSRVPARGSQPGAGRQGRRRRRRPRDRRPSVVPLQARRGTGPPASRPAARDRAGRVQRRCRERHRDDWQNRAGPAAKLLDEHRAILEASKRLGDVARRERKPQFLDLADRLWLHTRIAEEVLYPAAILLGEHLRITQVAKRPRG